MQRLDKESGGGMKSGRPAAHAALRLLPEALLPPSVAKRGAEGPVVLGRLILGPGVLEGAVGKGLGGHRGC